MDGEESGGGEGVLREEEVLVGDGVVRGWGAAVEEGAEGEDTEDAGELAASGVVGAICSGEVIVEQIGFLRVSPSAASATDS